MDAIQELGKLLTECGVELRIGLKQQGHIPTVERMLREGASWDEIGKAIGWHGPAVKQWYDYERESCI